MCSISAKTYENPFTCVRVIASQMWDGVGSGSHGFYSLFVALFIMHAGK